MGELYVVATPIGHLGDISERAVTVLGEVDLILAEDTRNSGVLLKHLGIRTPMQAYHEHSGLTLVEKLLARLMAGERMALISDAGTPLISDPGVALLKRVLQEDGISVIPVPGASAVMAALSASGLPATSFHFGGFLPSAETERVARLQELLSMRCTVVVFETPHRIVAALKNLAQLDPDRYLVIGRELTKMHESFYRGSATELFQQVQADSNMRRGEMVILLSAAPKAPAINLEADVLLKTLLSELSPSAAARIAARCLQLPKSQLYQRALQLEVKPGNPLQ